MSMGSVPRGQEGTLCHPNGASIGSGGTGTPLTMVRTSFDNRKGRGFITAKGETVAVSERTQAALGGDAGTQAVEGDLQNERGFLPAAAAN